MRFLAEMVVATDDCAAYVTDECTTTAPNFVAAVTLDESLITLGTGANLGRRNSFLDSDSSLRLLLFLYLITAKGYVSSFTAFST